MAKPTRTRGFFEEIDRSFPDPTYVQPGAPVPTRVVGSSTLTTITGVGPSLITVREVPSTVIYDDVVDSVVPPSPMRLALDPLIREYGVPALLAALYGSELNALEEEEGTIDDMIEKYNEGREQ